MERIRKYIGAPLVAPRLEAVEDFGARPRWVPEEIDDFDEIELALPMDDEEELLLTIAVEDGRMARILLSAARAGDDDADARGLSEAELMGALDRHGEALVALLEHLTP
jgi:hypothetical protein